jgi:hypothetical protein
VAQHQADLGEYKLRLVIACMILAGVVYAFLRHTPTGPAFFEIIIFGGTFAVGTIVHSVIKLRQARISRNDRPDGT